MYCENSKENNERFGKCTNFNFSYYKVSLDINNNLESFR